MPFWLSALLLHKWRKAQRDLFEEMIKKKKKTLVREDSYIEIECVLYLQKGQ